MKKTGVSFLLTAMLGVSVGMLGGCGGGGGGSSSSSSGTGSGSALTVADKVSVVDAQGSTVKAASLQMGRNLYLTAADVPANSDYYKDKQFLYVHEGSAEVFNTINEILCMMSQAKYGSMINKGAYKAQIDKNKCSSSNDDASSAGQSSGNSSSGSTAPSYELWTVDSSRADNNAGTPHIVKAWIHENGGGGGGGDVAKVIFAKVTITESASSTNPYGLFTINFKGQPVVNGVADTGAASIFKGFLKTEKDDTGKVLVKFVNDGGMGGFTFNEKVVLSRAADGSSGSGTTSTADGPPGTPAVQHNIAFSTANFLKQNVSAGGPQKCFSRTVFDETAWRYGLYDSNGARLNLNSGFPIKKGSSYGWIGYYGLWFPESVTVADGDTVSKVAYGANGATETAYTVVKKGGKLKKHTKNSVTLADIKNIPMDGWMEAGVNYRVKWNGTSIVKFAKQNQTTFMWENLGAETAISVAGMNFGDLNLYSQALGGQVRVKLSNCTFGGGLTTCDPPAGTTPVIYFTEDIVYPGDTVAASLKCYDNCPKYTALSGGISPSDPSYAPDFTPTAAGHSYTFSSAATDMILKDTGNPLTMSGAGTGQYQWGFISGPLFDPTANTTIGGVTKTNTAWLACDWDTTKTCGWKAWSMLPVFYTWETGPKDWNQFTSLKDGGGTALKFDPPVSVAYVHAQTNAAKPDYKYNGTKFYLEYSGFGNLWGVPGKCVSKDTNADVSCGPDTRWIAEFTIPDGSEMTNVSAPATKYLAKALEKEQRMTKLADTSACTTAGLTLTSYTLPSSADYVDPGIGTEPAVTNAPAVIGGVLQ